MPAASAAPSPGWRTAAPQSLEPEDGFTKLLFDPDTHRVLGGGTVGSNAGELISEVALAIENGCDGADIGLTIHPHPTLTETVAGAASVAGSPWCPAPRARCCSTAALRGTLRAGLAPECQVEAIEVHHLGPRRHEVFHKLLLRVRARIDFREGAQLRVRTEDQVDTGAGPL